MKTYTISGSPYERGRQLGELRKAEWRDEETPGPPVDPTAAAKWQKLRDNVCGFLSEHHPRIIEELRGIADGVGVGFDAVFVRNVFNALGPALPGCQLGCTSIGFTTSDVGPLLGKTLDGHAPDPTSPFQELAAACAERAQQVAACTIRPDREHAALYWQRGFTLFTECGVNEKGLCVGANSGRPAFTGQDGLGVPQHFMMRYSLLECATVDEAVEFVTGTTIAGKGINLCFVDAHGDAAFIESCHDMHSVRRPKNGVVFGTNHYIDPAMFKRGLDAQPSYLSSPHLHNSLSRFLHLQTQLEGGRRRLTFDSLRQTLRDHHNPGAVCQHPDNNDGGSLTSQAMIAVADRRELWLSEGIPCATEFVRFSLDAG